jgi:glycosyltransferase involved in cell wall biosynthesis/UDP-N-acetylglucosamine:LPS N-acetylglucosamine transferase
MIAAIPEALAKSSTDRSRNQRPLKVCLISSAGGHLAQLEAISRALQDFDRYVVTLKSSQSEDIMPGTRRYLIMQILRNPASFLVNFVQSLRIFLKERPDVVITTGAGDVLPTVFLAASLGATILFVESYARVSKPSLVGRLISRWCDCIFVQWAELKATYRDSILVSPIFETKHDASVLPQRPRVLVLTGTHTRGFDRLIEAIDSQNADGRLFAEVCAQIGHAVYRPRSIRSFRFVPRSELLKLIDAADLIITHDGAGSLGEALSRGKTTVVVPRRRDKGEVSYDSKSELAHRLGELGVVTLLDDPEEIPETVRRLQHTRESPRPHGSRPGPVSIELGRAIRSQLRDAVAPTSVTVYPNLVGRRVTLISPVNPWESRSSGIRTYLESLAGGLLGHGFLVRVVAFGRAPIVSQPGLEFRTLGTAGRSSIEFLASLLLNGASLRGGDIVHLQRLDHALPACLWVRTKTMVVTLHGETVRSVAIRRGRLQGAVLWLLEAVASFLVPSMIAVDSRTREMYETMFPWTRGKVKLIPVGVSVPSEYGPKLQDRPESQIPEGVPVVLWAGRLIPEKNVNLLVESFSRLLAEIPSAWLILVGDGLDESTVSSKLLVEGIPRVTVLRVLPRSQLWNLIQRADVLCVTSVFESGPLIALEAIAAGTPVVSTPVGRMTNVLHTWDVGRLSEPDSGSFSQGLADVIRRGKASYAGECAIASASLRFDSTLSATFAIYASVLGIAEGTHAP